MKRKRRSPIVLSLILSLVFSLAGCQGKAPPAPTEAEKTEESTVTVCETEEIVQSVTKEVEQVYEGAKKDYLFPQETFTRERIFAPEFVMIHFTSAVVLSKADPFRYESVREIFEKNEVSVHYLIDRDGTVYAFVPESLVAYHAGVGSWKNEEKYTNKLNDYAIGIELMAIGSEADMGQYLSKTEYQELDPSFLGFTDAQYEALEKLVSDICRRQGIPMDREHVIGHDEYSPKKTDPGELFDWSRLIR